MYISLASCCLRRWNVTSCSNKMLGAILLGWIITACASCARAQEGEIIVPNDNKTQCANDMVQWCNSMQYPQQGAGVSMVSITYEDPSGYYRVLCYSDSDGTNCTRNKNPWFSCAPDHTFSYKGQVLSANATNNNVDDDICKTADRAFNDLFVQNLSYDNTTLKKEVQSGMEAFFDQIAYMEEQILLLQKQMNSIPFLRDGFWPGFLESFIIEVPVETTTTYSNEGKMNNGTEQSNEIQKDNP